jgi:hypothetical protein
LQNGKARIVGASLFFVCSRDYFDKADDYKDRVVIADVYLIDLCHMEIFERDDQRDEGFLLGLRNVIELLRQI